MTTMVYLLTVQGRVDLFHSSKSGTVPCIAASLEHCAKTSFSIFESKIQVKKEVYHMPYLRIYQENDKCTSIKLILVRVYHAIMYKVVIYSIQIGSSISTDFY